MAAGGIVAPAVLPHCGAVSAMMRERPDRQSSDDRQTGPSFDAVEEARDLCREALSKAGTDTFPDVPPLRYLRVLQRAEPLPWVFGDAAILDVSTRAGRPLHGAMRSDDHVSSFEAVVTVEQCPECGHDKATFEYSSYHHIAGGMSLVCRRCGHVHGEEDWS